MEKKRQVNLEILRMISMFMIIVIHIVNHGWMIDLVQKGTASYYIVWFLFGIGFISINIYFDKRLFSRYEQIFLLEGASYGAAGAFLCLGHYVVVLDYRLGRRKGTENIGLFANTDCL